MQVQQLTFAQGGQPAGSYFSDLIFNTFSKPAKPAPRQNGIFKGYSILTIVMPKHRINCLPMFNIIWHHQLTKSPYCAFPYFKNCTFKNTCTAECRNTRKPNFYNGVMNCTIDAHKIDCNCLAFADLETVEGAKELKIFLIHCLLFGSLVLICKV